VLFYNICAWIDANIKGNNNINNLLFNRWKWNSVNHVRIDANIKGNNNISNLLFNRWKWNSVNHAQRGSEHNKIRFLIQF